MLLLQTVGEIARHKEASAYSERFRYPLSENLRDIELEVSELQFVVAFSLAE